MLSSVCTLGKLELKRTNYLPSAQAIHYNLKDLFDLEGSVMPTLVENGMTNKPMGHKTILGDFHSSLLYLIRLPNLLIC